MNDVMEWISLFFVMSGVVSAIIIACDLPQHKQMMKIMNVVWVLTGLWASYLALWAYFSFGRGKHTVINNYKKPGEEYNPTSDMQMGR